MKLKKLLALALAAFMTISFTACQTPTSSESSDSSESTSSESESSQEETDTSNMDGDAELSAPGEFPIVLSDKITLSVFTAPAEDSNAELDSSVNWFSNWFEEKTNIHLDWTIVTKSDKTAKLNLLFTTDDYEDIIFGAYWDTSTQAYYGEQGYIIPLEDYLETDAYYYDLWKAAKIEDQPESADSFNDMISPDGHTYSLFGAMDGNQYHARVSLRMWIYEPWLEALDLDMPTTTEEYYDVLLAFKEQDPNGNGEADEIPLMGANTGWNTNPIDFLMNSFLYYDTSKLYVDNGEVKAAYSQDAFKDGLTYINSLVEAGLLSNDTFTQENTSLKALAASEPNIIGSIPAGMTAGFITTTDQEEGEWTNWVTVAPLEGPDGVQYTRYSPTQPDCRFVITSNCEYPKAAFRLGDALMEPTIAFTSIEGEEGVKWRYAEEGELDQNGETATVYYIDGGASSSNGGETNYAWGNLASASTFPGWTEVIGGDPSLSSQIALYESEEIYKPYIPSMDIILPTLSFSEEDATLQSDYNTALTTYVTEKMVDFICNGNIEEGWDSYLQGLQDRNLDEFLAIQQEAYDSRIALTE